MSRAGRLLFVLGILIATASGFGVFVLLLLSQPKPAEVPTTKVVVAFQEIAPRSAISPDQVGTANWPRALPTPAGAIEDPTEVVGKLATTSIYPSQPILSKMLIDKAEAKETHSNAALILEKGSVGTAMQVTLKSNVAEAIQPGDRVDVIATFRSQSTNPAAASAVATQRLLADVLILQVGPWPQKPQAQGGGGSSTAIITVQLKEQDALILEYAVLHADAITLVLRPANDHDLIPLEPVTLDYINQRFGFKLPR